MLNTQVRPSRDLRNNYAEIIRTLNKSDHVIITNNGVGEAVLISFEQYAKYEEYLHHQYIYNELQKSKKKASDPNVELRHSADVFARLERRLGERGL
jgi:prevent-host-death family protein